MQITEVNMQYFRVISGLLLLLLTASAIPEIPTKGKHNRNQDVQQTNIEEADMPRFAEAIANVTVSVGRDALLACVVENLKGYKVAWVRVDTQTILSIHHNVISQNNRISLTYNDHRSWYLHIKEVEETDRGWYMCQVNTDPMRSRKGYLQVVVPPVILEGMTSNDLVVREGLNVTLMCKARGYPEPYVMWRREDGEEMLIGGEHVNVVDGELLHITKVSRLHMAAYLCVASNGVPPSISKRVHLRVQFPPMLSIPNQLEGAYVGQDVVLECHTEAYPASINYWTTERGDMIISDTSRAGDKYETTSTISGYTKYMKLKIRSVGANDFGTYRCVAKNSLGETDGNIKLDEMPAPTTTLTFDAAMNRSTGLAGNYPSSMYNSNGYGRSINSIGGRDDNNNQASIRNPPGAFHNSGSTMAQQNLLVYIIKEIKIQSIGIWQRLLIIFNMKNFNNDRDNPFSSTKTKTTTIDDDQPLNSKDLSVYKKMHKIVTKEDYKDKEDKNDNEQQKRKMSMKIKRIIELWGLIGNSHWQNLLLVTMSQIFIQKLTSSSLTRVSNIPTIPIDATTILNILEEAKPTAQCIVISYCTEAAEAADATATATCIIDNPFNGHPNEQLHVKYNDNDNNYNNNNIIKLYKCKRNNCNNGNNRQPNCNVHSSMEYNCGSSISRHKFIVTSNNRNHENVHFFANILSLAPLATFLLYFLLLLLLLWYSNIGPSSSSSVAVTETEATLNDHIICCILSGIEVKQQQQQQQRLYLNDNNLCYHTTRRLSSNSQHYFNNNSIEQQQKLKICITTTNMISNNCGVFR